jgi:hypothetical protein
VETQQDPSGLRAVVFWDRRVFYHFLWQGGFILITHVFPLVHPPGGQYAIFILLPEFASSGTSVDSHCWSSFGFDLRDHVEPFLVTRALWSCEQTLGYLGKLLNFDLCVHWDLLQREIDVRFSRFKHCGSFSHKEGICISLTIFSLQITGIDVVIVAVSACTTLELIKGVRESWARACGSGSADAL